jgi:hypothetical protein
MAFLGAQVRIAHSRDRVNKPAMSEVTADPGASQEGALSRAERGVGTVVLGDGALSRDLFDAVVDIRTDGTWTRIPTKEETR